MADTVTCGFCGCLVNTENGNATIPSDSVASDLSKTMAEYKKMRNENKALRAKIKELKHGRKTEPDPDSEPADPTEPEPAEGGGSILDGFASWLTGANDGDE